jgi:hypothetical protein
MNNAFQLIHATGLFVEDCKLRKRRNVADTTWDQFKTFFSQSHREFRDGRGTTVGATNYQSNNVVHQQDTIDAIANLAAATSHDREAVSTLTSTNSALIKELTSVNAKLVTALLANTQLTVQLATNLPNTAAQLATNLPNTASAPKPSTTAGPAARNKRTTAASALYRKKAIKKAQKPQIPWAGLLATSPPDIRWGLVIKIAQAF